MQSKWQHHHLHLPEPLAADCKGRHIHALAALWGHAVPCGEQEFPADVYLVVSDWGQSELPIREKRSV
jgi:hypothetical protein